MSDENGGAEDAAHALDMLEQASLTLRTALQALPGQLAAQRSELDAAVNGLAAELEAFRQDVPGLEERLAGAAADLAAAVEASDAELQAALASWSAQAEVARADIDQALEALAPLPAALMDEIEQFHGASERFAEGLEREASAPAKAGSEDAQTQLGHMADALGDADAVLQASLDTLFERSHAANLAITATIETQLVPSLNAASGMLAARVHQVLDNGMRTHVDAAVQQIETAVLGATSTLLGELLSRIQAMIQASADALLTQGEAGTAQRMKLEPVRRELEAVVAPIQDALDHIKGIAGQVGFSL